MADANNTNCKDYIPLIVREAVPTEGSGSTAELHSEIIQFCYAFIDYFRCCSEQKAQNKTLLNRIDVLEEELRKDYTDVGIFDGVTTIHLTHPAPQFVYEVAKYLQVYGAPEDGIFDAQILAKYRQEKLDLGYDIDY